MTARRDLTHDEWRLIRARAANRVSKKAVAAELGMSPKALTQCAIRDGREVEIRALFPVNPAAVNAFKLTEGMRNRVRTLVSYGMNAAEVAERLGVSRSQFSDAVKRAGMTAELAELRKVARTNTAAHDKTLPREIDPAVKWLTKEWRKAA